MLVAEPPPALVDDDAVAGVLDLALAAARQVEGLRVLDRVARFGGTDGFCDDAVEIDELLAAQEVVDLGLASLGLRVGRRFGTRS
jgi:hypothetical protein